MVIGGHNTSEYNFVYGCDDVYCLGEITSMFLAFIHCNMVSYLVIFSGSAKSILVDSHPGIPFGLLCKILCNFQSACTHLLV